MTAVSLLPETLALECESGSLAGWPHSVPDWSSGIAARTLSVLILLDYSTVRLEKLCGFVVRVCFVVRRRGRGRRGRPSSFFFMAFRDVRVSPSLHDGPLGCVAVEAQNQSYAQTWLAILNQILLFKNTILWWKRRFVAYDRLEAWITAILFTKS